MNWTEGYAVFNAGAQMLNNGYKSEDPVSRTVSDGRVEVNEIEIDELAVDTEVETEVDTDVEIDVDIEVDTDVETEVTVDVLPVPTATYAPTAATTIITTTIATTIAVLTALLGLEEILFNILSRNSMLGKLSLFIPKIEYD